MRYRMPLVPIAVQGAVVLVIGVLLSKIVTIK
jgi:hypothetical protein